MDTLLPTITPSSNARERILATAHHHFYLEGIRATGIDRIIAESGVTKVTFYRHFPSKNDLILAYLEDRHQRWTAWFSNSLERYGNQPDALIPTLSEWFHHANFRGCAFINGMNEMAGVLPQVITITQRHKEAMTEIVARLYKKGKEDEHASMLAIAIDGAIIHAQYDQTPAKALALLAHIQASLS